MQKLNILNHTNLSHETLKLLKNRFDISLVDSPCAETLIVEETFFDWNHICLLINQKKSFTLSTSVAGDSCFMDKELLLKTKYIHKQDEELQKFYTPFYKKEVLAIKPMVLLDRDGIINVDTGYVYQFKKEDIFQDTLEFVRQLNELKIPVAIVTNQAGVGRGLYSVDDVNQYHLKLESLYKESSAYFSHIEICPFHTTKGEGKWKVDSILRKPNPGMILNSLVAMDCSVMGSLMIGDKESDRVDLLGLEFFLLKGNYPIEFENNVYSSRQELFKNSLKYLNKTLDFS